MKASQTVRRYIETALRERIAKECPGYGPSTVEDVVRVSMTHGGVTKETLYRAIELAAEPQQHGNTAAPQLGDRVTVLALVEPFYMWDESGEIIPASKPKDLAAMPKMPDRRAVDRVPVTPFEAVFVGWSVRYDGSLQPGGEDEYWPWLHAELSRRVAMVVPITAGHRYRKPVACWAEDMVVSR